jgi:hypothetical protein
MKITCLSVRLPWSWMILQGSFNHKSRQYTFKDVENRSETFWKLNRQELEYVRKCGQRLYIHAGQTFDSKGFDDLVLAGYRSLLPLRDSFATFPGGVLGSVRFIGWILESSSQWFQGQSGLLVADPIPFDDVFKCRGSLGLFKVDLPPFYAKMALDCQNFYTERKVS